MNAIGSVEPYGCSSARAAPVRSVPVSARSKDEPAHFARQAVHKSRGSKDGRGLIRLRSDDVASLVGRSHVVDNMHRVPGKGPPQSSQMACADSLTDNCARLLADGGGPEADSRTLASAAARPDRALLPSKIVATSATAMSGLGQSRHFGRRPTTFAVGTRVTSRPPHRSVRAQFGHTAPTLGV